MFGRNQIHRIFSNDLFARHGVQDGSRGVAVQNIARFVFDKDRVWRTFKQSLKQAFTVS
jgi:hypothetical protein